MCLVLAGDFFDSVIAMQLWLSSNTLYVTKGGVVMISQATNKSFSKSINGIISRIAIDNTMYSASHVDNAISVCNLLR